MDRLRHLLHNPLVLAAYPSPRRILAFTPDFAIQNPGARMDRNVGSRSCNHSPVARHRTLREQMDVDSRGSFILRWSASL